MRWNYPFCNLSFSGDTGSSWVHAYCDWNKLRKQRLNRNQLLWRCLGMLQVVQMSLWPGVDPSCQGVGGSSVGPTKYWLWKEMKLPLLGIRQFCVRCRALWFASEEGQMTHVFNQGWQSYMANFSIPTWPWERNNKVLTEQDKCYKYSSGIC